VWEAVALALTSAVLAAVATPNQGQPLPARLTVDRHQHYHHQYTLHRITESDAPGKPDLGPLWHRDYGQTTKLLP